MGFGRLILLIFLFTFVEVMVMAKVADYTGWLFVILAIVFMAFLGSLLFRRQGWATWVRLNQRLQQGELPGEEMVESLMLLIGALLLMLPGFITDALGLVLLLPFARRAMAKRLVRQGALNAFAGGAGRSGAFVFTQTQYYRYPPDHEPQSGPGPDLPPVRETLDGHLIIEGKAERKDD